MTKTCNNLNCLLVSLDKEVIHFQCPCITYIVQHPNDLNLDIRKSYIHLKIKQNSFWTENRQLTQQVLEQSPVLGGVANN
jgi:hypothetical protein